MLGAGPDDGRLEGVVVDVALVCEVTGHERRDERRERQVVCPVVHVLTSVQVGGAVWFKTRANRLAPVVGGHTDTLVRITAPVEELYTCDA